MLAEHGVGGRCAVTAVTAQTDRHVAAVRFVPAEVITKQIECALQTGVKAIKIGMLGTPEIVGAVTSALAEVTLPIVIDPVLLSSSGHPLLDPAGREMLLTNLAPRAARLTPSSSREVCGPLGVLLGRCMAAGQRCELILRILADDSAILL